MSIRGAPNYLPTEATEPTEVSGARYSPTDCTDIHRLGGYGILPYPRSHQTIFPQKPTQPNHLCASVKSVGGSSPPEASVYSVKSVGEYPPLETSVNSVNSVGGLAQTNLEWVLWKEFGGQRGYGRNAIPSYENSHRLHRYAQIRRVWHPCHTHAATKLSSHRIHGTHRNDWRRRKICEFCEIRGRLFSARSFCVFCEICGRISSARNFCEFREFCGRTCANKLGMGSVEGIRRAAWVWQECHTLLRKLPQIAQICTD